MSSLRFEIPSWPRFLTTGLHRNLSLTAVLFLALHIVTAVVDPFTHLGWLAAVVPFSSYYRTFWLGLGVIAFELLIAITVTSLVRGLIGLSAWRAIHWLSYASWPIAVLHGFGTGDRHIVNVDAGHRWRLHCRRGRVRGRPPHVQVAGSTRRGSRTVPRAGIQEGGEVTELSLFAGPPPPAGPESFRDHTRRLGPRPRGDRALIDTLDRSGLVGRGGASFPVGVKWRAVQSRSRGAAVVIANGAEGEPLSRKDRTLMSLRPHLVIDGALLAADAVGASRTLLYIGEAHGAAAAAMARAVAERSPAELATTTLLGAPRKLRRRRGNRRCQLRQYRGRRPARNSTTTL